MSALADKLLETGLLSPQQLQLARIEQHKTQKPLRQVILDLKLISAELMQSVLNEQQRTVDLTNLLPSPAALALIDHRTARSLVIMPIDVNGVELTVASATPDDLLQLDQVRAAAGVDYQVRCCYASADSIYGAIDKFYGYQHSLDAILQELAGVVAPQLNQNALQSGELAEPIIRLLNALLHHAIRSRASDIHFEPEQHFVRIRYRIDGVLQQVKLIHKSVYAALIVRIKVLANLDISDSRALQDGNFSLQLAAADYDFRVAIMPTIYAENIVLRILDSRSGLKALNELALQAEELKTLQLILAKPDGLTLVTGPTGSGKTTTLYSIMQQLNRLEVNIMTLEDPVEYKMPQLRQCAVNAAAKLTFDNGVRAILRQDPDIILVGEIRDKDTATMALRAALTGHKVFATLHCQSALAAISRMRDIGVKSAALHGNISAVIAQRLLRRLCEHCKCKYAISAAEQNLLAKISEINAVELEKVDSLYRAEGCEHCAGIGYYQRLCIMEVVNIDRQLDELIYKRRSYKRLQQAAVAGGMVPLAVRGAQKLLAGVTSFAEFARVVDLTGYEYA